MEAVVDLFDRVQHPIYEPVVYARVCDILHDYRYDRDVTPGEFLRTLALLNIAKHIERVKRREPRSGCKDPMPHVQPTLAGRIDFENSRSLLHDVMHRSAR
jgi:hypothetical protein